MTSAASIILPPSWCRKHLSPAEQRVVQLAAAGLATKDIARTLQKSTLTARNQLNRAMRKLGIRSRYELIAQLRPLPKPAPGETADCFAYAI